MRYGETVVYRTSGAAKAARYGAVAAIVRSITPFSIESPHTGNLYYDDVDENGKIIFVFPWNHKKAINTVGLFSFIMDCFNIKRRIKLTGRK